MKYFQKITNPEVVGYLEIGDWRVIVTTWHSLPLYSIKCGETVFTAAYTHHLKRKFAKFH
jgi:hypothetical protein